MRDGHLSTLGTARHLWERVATDRASDTRVTAAAARVLVDLEHGMRRWIGVDGYSALLRRAVADTLPAHPALHAVPGLPLAASDAPFARDYSADDVSAAMVALLAALIALLGRVIGEDMAGALVDHIGNNARRPTDTESNPGPSDG
jgi:hypothetical protein